jgi:phosphatidylglycerophosphate synthase
MGFWSLYTKSCKPGDSEETLDRYFFRPLAYPIARLSLPIKFITPTMITIISIVFGVGTTVVLVMDFPYHLQIAAGLMLLTNTLDCSDGMLARMRGTSSAIGRMIDGFADFLWTIMFSAATLWLVVREYHAPWWVLAIVLVAGAATFATSAVHLAMFDFNRNQWVRFTRPDFKAEDGELYADAVKRHDEARKTGKIGVVWWAIWQIYFVFIKGQEDIIQKWDPDRLPVQPFNAELAQLYKKHYERPWLMFRVLFGSTSLCFGLMIVALIELPVAYLIFRVTIVNILFYGVARTWMRRATKNLRAELASAASSTPALAAVKM